MPVVKRPTLANKGKSSSSARLSFGGSGERVEDGNDASDTFAPKKSDLSRKAAENNAERKLRTSLPLPSRDSEGSSLEHERPTYSQDYINELKSSTPSAPSTENPHKLAHESTELTSITILDVEAKFGSSTSRQYTSSIIPTNAEVREKKARRARLAKEKNAKSIILDDADPSAASDDEFGKNEISLRLPDKYTETRLVPDDEDIAEGFDEFVVDEKLSFDKVAKTQAADVRRAHMATMIDEAEGPSSDESDEDEFEYERKQAYVTAQTKAGTYSTLAQDRAEVERPRTPLRMTPIPDISTALKRLRNIREVKNTELQHYMERLEALRREKAELTEREVWIQGQLKEAGEKYEEMMKAAVPGAQSLLNSQANGDPGSETPNHVQHRGLETLGDSIPSSVEASVD